jgi:fatty-acyl-CoA synthase
MEYLQREVGEKAAIPKEVILTPTIPLTPVGKVFKPALVRDAIWRVCDQVLGGMGDLISTRKVAVAEDKLLGSVAHIAVNPLPNVSFGEVERKVRDSLAKYSFRIRITQG